jgi:endonuclease/exonuclease/phosphatase family metal-dependent hydrolase
MPVDPVSHNTVQTRPPPKGSSVLEVLTFNMLNHAHYERHATTPHRMALSERLSRLVGALDAAVSNPAVAFVCLQEVNPQQVRPVFDLLKARGFYVLINDAGPKCTDCVCLASRSARFKAVGSPLVVPFHNAAGQAASGKTGLLQLYEDLQTHILCAVASVHLFWEKEDKDKAARVVDMVRSLVTVPTGNYIVAGDFNIDYRAARPVMLSAMKGWVDATDGLPWTAATGKGVPGKIDYVYFAGPHLGLERAQQPRGSVLPGSEALLLKHDGNEPITPAHFASDHAIVSARILLHAQ